MTTQRERDEITGTETTGHEWDGIKELNSPLPRWWLWVLYATIVWSVGYWILMPAWPTLRSYTGGWLGYSQRATVAAELEEARAARAVYHERVSTAELEAIKSDPELLEIALAGGRAAFGDNCAPCHGTGAQGFKGYPNLNDDAWLWGGSLEDIHASIAYGIRADHEETRVNDMPAFLRDEILDRDQVDQVADFVLSLSNGQAENAEGKAIFDEQCAACHGTEGRGLTEVGGPNLADAIWLYGDDRETVIDIISNSRGGVMPAWSGRLDPITIKELAVYVHALGGGE